MDGGINVSEMSIVSLIFFVPGNNNSIPPAGRKLVALPDFIK